MQVLLSRDAQIGMPSMRRGEIDLIYIVPSFDSIANYKIKINIPKTDIEAKPTVIE